MKISIRKIGFVLLSAALLAGCNDNVSSLKSSVMDDYPSTTIGKAFDASFANSKWETFETEKGISVVGFTGTIKSDMHDAFVPDFNSSPQEALIAFVLKDATDQDLQMVNSDLGKLALFAKISKLERSAKANPEKRMEINDSFIGIGDSVTFQWSFSNDGESFELSYIDEKPWDQLNLDQVLGAIYN